MAVELSGDTGAAIQSHIHVQSARSSTSCHNNYDRSIETFFSVSPSHLCSPWLALVARKVIVISQNFITWWHKAISIVGAVPILLPLKGVHTICAWQHPVGLARWCLREKGSLSYWACSLITWCFRWLRRVFTPSTNWLLLVNKPSRLPKNMIVFVLFF